MSYTPTRADSADMTLVVIDTKRSSALDDLQKQELACSLQRAFSEEAPAALGPPIMKQSNWSSTADAAVAVHGGRCQQAVLAAAAVNFCRADSASEQEGFPWPVSIAQQQQQHRQEEVEEDGGNMDAEPEQQQQQQQEEDDEECLLQEGVKRISFQDDVAEQSNCSSSSASVTSWRWDSCRSLKSRLQRNLSRVRFALAPSAEDLTAGEEGLACGNPGTAEEEEDADLGLQAGFCLESGPQQQQQEGVAELLPVLFSRCNLDGSMGSRVSGWDSRAGRLQDQSRSSVFTSSSITSAAPQQQQQLRDRSALAAAAAWVNDDNAGLGTGGGTLDTTNCIRHLPEEGYSNESLLGNSNSSLLGIDNKLVPASPAATRRRAPPSRRPSRIMISPVAPDGSRLEEPKLFISMPRSSGARRRVGRSRTQYFETTSCSGASVATEPAALPGRSSVSFTGPGSVGGSTARSWARGGLGLAAPHRMPSVEMAAAIAAGDPAAGGLLGAVADKLVSRQGSLRSWEKGAELDDWVNAEEEVEEQQQQGLPLVDVLEEERLEYHQQQKGQQQKQRSQLAGEVEVSGVCKDDSMMVLDGRDMDFGLEEQGAYGERVLCSDEEEEDSEDSEEWWCSDLTGVVVAEIMTTPLPVIAQETDAQVARTLMTQHELHFLLVDCGPGTEPGFITRGDFFKVPMKKKASKKKKLLVRDLMSTPVVSVEVGTAIEEAAANMQASGVTWAVVVDTQLKDAEKHLAHYVGLITDTAIFRCLGLHAENDNSSQEDVDEALLMIGSRAASAAVTEASLMDRLTSARTTVSDQASDKAAVGTADEEPSAGAQGPLLQQQPSLRLLGSVGGGSSSSSIVGGTPRGVLQPSNSSSSMHDQLQQQEVVVIRSESLEPEVEREISFASATSGVSSAVSGSGPSGFSTFSMAGSTAPEAMRRFRSVVSLWELDFDEVQMIKKIGEGSFGEVMLGNFRGTKVREHIYSESPVV